MQNESETEFHRVYKVSPTQQLTKLTHLLRESGDVVVTGSVVDQLKQTAFSQTAAHFSRLTENKHVIYISVCLIHTCTASHHSGQMLMLPGLNRPMSETCG